MENFSNSARAGVTNTSRSDRPPSTGEAGAHKAQPEGQIPRYKQQLKVIEGQLKYDAARKKSAESTRKRGEDKETGTRAGGAGRARSGRSEHRHRRSSAPGVRPPPRGMALSPDRRVGSTDSLFDRHRKDPRGRRLSPKDPLGQRGRGESPGGRPSRGISPLAATARARSPSSRSNASSVASPTSKLLHFFTGTELPPDPFDGELPACTRPPMVHRPRSDPALRISRGSRGSPHDRPPPSPLSPHGFSQLFDDRPRSRPRQQPRQGGHIPRYGSLDSIPRRSGGLSSVEYARGSGSFDMGPQNGGRQKDSPQGLLATFAYLVSPPTTARLQLEKPPARRRRRGTAPPRDTRRSVSPLASREPSPRLGQSADGRSTTPADTPDASVTPEKELVAEKSRGFSLSGIFRRGSTNGNTSSTSKGAGEKDGAAATLAALSRPDPCATEPRPPRGKAKGNVRKWSSIPTMPPLSRFTDRSGPQRDAYPWQLCSEEHRLAAVEERRLELLEMDLTSDPSLSDEWMAVLQFRAAHSFLTKHDGPPTDPLDGADSTTIDLNGEAEEEGETIRPLEQQNFGALVIRVGRHTPDADVNVEAFEAPTNGGDENTGAGQPATKTLTFAGADEWLWNVVQHKQLEAPGLPAVEIPVDVVAMRSSRGRPPRKPLAVEKYPWCGDASRMEQRRQQLLAMDIDAERGLLEEWMALLEARFQLAKSN